MNMRETLGYIYRDYRRYRATGEKGWLQVVFLSQGFWASSVYRLSHLVYTEVTTPLVRPVLRFLTRIAQKGIEILTGISLPAGCQVGPGLYIGHFGHIIVHPEVQIGDNCNLSQGVTIGLIARGRATGVPRLGHRVFVGPNAIILGGVTVGDDVAIGAGAVVTQSVPPLAVMVGNPARIVSYQGSFEYVQFDGMQADLQRSRAYTQREARKEQVGSHEQ